MWSREVAAARRKIERRLEGAAPSGDRGEPMMGGGQARYEVAARTEATIHGGIGLAHRVARSSGLVAAIDRVVNVLKIHCPYYESDHVLNIAFVRPEVRIGMRGRVSFVIAPDRTFSHESWVQIPDCASPSPISTPKTAASIPLAPRACAIPASIATSSELCFGARVFRR